MPEKFIEYLEEAERIIKASDHMLYVTFPIIKDKKLLINILLEIRKALANCINSILQYEHLQGKINLTKNSRENFEIFTKECAPKYEISESEIKTILELFELLKRHKESPMEFMRNNEVIILSENLGHEKISVDKTKQFLSLVKSILIKIKSKIIAK